MEKNKRHGTTRKPQGMNLAQTKKWEREEFDRIVQAEAWKIFLKWSQSLQQEVMDAAFMAANDVLKMGPGRCEEFGRRVILYRNEISNLINSDAKDDPDIVYAKAKIDERLKQICGDKFEPWEVRYKDGQRTDGD